MLRVTYGNLTLLGMSLASCISASPLLAQGTYFKTFGAGTYTEAYAVETTSSGGCVVTGRTGGSSADDVFVMRTDGEGDTLWTRAVRSGGNEYGRSILETADGGFAIAGFTNGLGAGENDGFLIKTQPTGEVSWAKTYGSTRDDQVYCVRQTTDGGFVLAGYTNGSGYDFYLTRTDNAGNLLWTRTFGGDGTDQAFAVCQTLDGGFAIAGRTYSFGAGFEDIYVIKTDSAGAVHWSKTIGGAATDEASSIEVTSDGALIIAGRTNSFGAGGTDILLVKASLAGDILWSKTYGGTGSEMQSVVRETSDGGFVISATTTSFGGSGADHYLVKLDSTGSVDWSRKADSFALDNSYGVRPTTDGGYIVAGTSNGLGPLATSLALMKMDATGQCGCFQTPVVTTVASPTFTIANAPTTVPMSSFSSASASFAISSGATSLTHCQTTVAVEMAESPIGDLEICPNPAIDAVAVRFRSESALANARILLTDVSGKIVQPGVSRGSSLFESHGADPGESLHSTIDVTTLPRGVYFVTIDLGGKASVSKKLVKR